MEDENKLELQIEKLSKILDLMDSFSVKQATATKQNLRILKDFEEEVTILRGCNDDIDKTIKSSVSDNMPKIAAEIHKSVHNIFKKEINVVTDPVNTLGEKMSRFTQSLSESHKSHQLKLKKISLFFSIGFCFSSLLTGFGLWYFFPQHHTVEFSMDQRRAMEYGTLLQFALPKLSEKDRQTIMDTMGESWEEYYKDLFADGGKK